VAKMVKTLEHTGKKRRIQFAAESRGKKELIIAAKRSAGSMSEEGDRLRWESWCQ